MFAIRPAAAAFVCLSAVLAQVPQAEFHTRREAARKKLGDAVLVLFSRAPGAEPGPDKSFYYLTGWSEPGAILMLSAEREILFLPARNPEVEKYVGRQSAAGDEDARRITGFDEVLPVSRFEAEFARALESHARILALPRGDNAAKLKALAPMRELSNAADFIGALRAKKSPAEIALIERATDVSVDAHKAAWKRMAPGLFEYQLAATMTFVMLDAGCEGNAYDPIVGSGINGTVLHYDKNSRRMDLGDLVVMDVGARCGGYDTDITRTAPVSGKFNPRQLELYNIVLGAQKAALAVIKPGTTMEDVNRAAREYIDSHGKDRNGGRLGKYLTHKISHGVGLDVHDYPTHVSAEPFEAGMIITAEPGLYIPEERIGIRIEDTVLVTEDGVRVLSGGLPTNPAQIEKLMAK